MASVSLPSLRQIYNKCHLSASPFLKKIIFLFWLHYFWAFISLKQILIRHRSEHVFETDLDNCIVVSGLYYWWFSYCVDVCLLINHTTLSPIPGRNNYGCIETNVIISTHTHTFSFPCRPRLIFQKHTLALASITDSLVTVISWEKYT